MRKLNKKLIQQLANGDAAVKNTGTVEEIQEIIKAAFPGSGIPPGNAKFYKKYIGFDWIGNGDSPTLPIHPVSDFFIEEEQSTDIEEELKWGEPVMVRDSENGEWRGNYLYVGRNPKTNAEHSYIVVNKNNGFPVHWKFCKRNPPKTRFSRTEYAEKLGISVDQIGDVKLID